VGPHEELRQELRQEVEQEPQSAAVEAEPAGITELVRLVGRLQEENRQIAGQAGFFRAKWEDAEAQLHQAQETIKLLQAPTSTAMDGGDAVTFETIGDVNDGAGELGQLKAELEQARQQIAAFEAAADAARRPWWRFW
jgi:chromosome segregation ATPase